MPATQAARRHNQAPPADVWTPEALVNLTPIQLKLLKDQYHRFIMVCAGRRARKSLICRRKILFHALTHPQQRYFHAAPARPQAKGIFWDALKRDTKGFWAKLPNETDLKVYLLNGSTIQVESLDRAFRLEGRPWRGFHITEYPNSKPGIWDANLRPLLADTGGFALIDGVPDAQTAVAAEYRDMAKYACGGSIPENEPQIGAFGENGEWAYYSWDSEDVLPAAEIAMIKANTDPVMYNQEYRGSFVTLSGLVYYGFVADDYPQGNQDTTVDYDPNLPIYAAFDFNVDPMTATLTHIKQAKDGPNKGKKEIYAFKSYSIRNSNTESMTNRICNEYPDTRTWYITTCQSGKARQTSADIGVTDRRILKRTLQDRGKLVFLKHRSKNPRVKDMVNCQNAMLHHNRIRLHPTHCRELITDYESLVYKPGTSDIDDSDKLRGHLSDGMGYLTEFWFPLRPKGGMQYNADVVI